MKNSAFSIQNEDFFPYLCRVKKMCSDKPVVNALVQQSVALGIREVVFSPGSRNAPLVFSFSACEAMRCFTVVDERSAAFFALGLAQQLRRPVALVCTSGTAVLNYAPAIAEAYYQQIPLVVITADRPPEWIDQADGQCIRQVGVYSNYIGHSVQLTMDGGLLTVANRRLIKEALGVALERNVPVHINVPLDEPLYGRQPVLEPQAATSLCKEIAGHTSASLGNQARNDGFADCQSNKVMFLLGMLPPDEELNALLSRWAERGAVVLTETVSNVCHSQFVGCIDRVLATIAPEEESDFAPELLITFDGQVTSKKIKQFLRKQKPREHWHVSPNSQHPDTYRSLSRSIYCTPPEFLKNLPIDGANEFAEKWKLKKQQALMLHNQLVAEASWSDLRVFAQIALQLRLGNGLPDNTLLQLANSTPIRYAQLFEAYYRFDCYANRGTGGIDGCTSTAVGASVAAKRPTLLLTGDLSFLYDSNALWNDYLRPDFKIILINNGGGGIFRYIGGKMSEEEMQRSFEVRQSQVSIEGLVKAYGLSYFRAEDEGELQAVLPEFFGRNDRPALLEVFTLGEENADVLRAYFRKLEVGN